MYAPWLVPMAIANESTPVLATNSAASSGSVKVALRISTFTSSSIPASLPSSASTTTPLLWAYSTTCLVRAIFSSNGNLEPSIITDVNPSSTHFLHISKSSPWSRWRQISNWVSSTAASTSFSRYAGRAYFLAPAET